MVLNLKKEVNELGIKLQESFDLFPAESDQVEKDMNEEGVKQPHWGKEYSTWQDYLLDSPNAPELKDPWNKTHTLEKEYKLRKQSVLNAFAVVITEWFYSKMFNEADQKKKKEWYEKFEEVRKHDWGTSAEFVFGSKNVAGGDTTSNLRSWAKTTDGTTAYDYGLTFDEAIKWMFQEGNKAIPTTSTNPVKKVKKTNGWKNVGFCQRYVGNDPNELKKVGLGQRYYG